MPAKTSLPTFPSTQHGTRCQLAAVAPGYFPMSKNIGSNFLCVWKDQTYTTVSPIFYLKFNHNPSPRNH
jgi:hypothetical protein